MQLFLFTNTAQRELFQYVHREYETSINFLCLLPWVEQRNSAMISNSNFSIPRYLQPDGVLTYDILSYRIFS